MKSLRYKLVEATPSTRLAERPYTERLYTETEISQASEDETWLTRPTLEIVDVSNEMEEDEQSGDCNFLCTSVTVRVNTYQNFVLEIYERLRLTDLLNLDLTQLDLTDVAMEDIPREFAWALATCFEIAVESIKTFPIPVENVCPEYTSSLTPAPGGMLDYYYFKYACLDRYAAKPNNGVKELVLTEALVCEILKKNPHPNIAKYWGVHIVDGRIRALCFAKYTMTLAQRLNTGVPLDRYRCLEGIYDGIIHMHRLGLVHNDINPHNIMIDQSDGPVIIDFDSCTREGQKIVKGWTPGWCIENAKTGLRENDFYGLKKLEEYLFNTR